MPTPTGPAFNAANRQMKGRLARRLLALQNLKYSTEEIAVMLRVEHDVKVSGESVRRWLIELNGVEVAS